MQRASGSPAAPPPSAPAVIRMGGAEWALIVLHSMLWGSSFFFGALAIRELPQG